MGLFCFGVNFQMFYTALPQFFKFFRLAELLQQGKQYGLLAIDAFDILEDGYLEEMIVGPFFHPLQLCEQGVGRGYFEDGADGQDLYEDVV